MSVDGTDGCRTEEGMKTLVESWGLEYPDDKEEPPSSGKKQGSSEKKTLSSGKRQGSSEKKPRASTKEQGSNVRGVGCVTS